VFYVIVPLGALSWLCSWFALAETPKEPERRLDWVGFIALTVAIGAMTLTLNRGERLDWFASTEIILTTAIAVVSFYVFVVHSLTTRQPFLDRGLLADRTYVLSILLIFIYGGYNFLPLFVLPLLLNDVMGYPLATIGMLLSTRSAGVLFGVIVIARFVDRFDPRIVILAGFICLIVPQWAMSTWNQNVGWWDITWPMILQGIGSGVP
jgi:DHA2 family multidrug resistance protein